MSTSRSRVMARAAVVAAFATTAVFGLTGTASAHSGEISASCDTKSQKSSVSINLWSYSKGSTNEWTLTDNGKQLAKGSFGDGHKQTWAEQDATIAHKYELIVKTSDDPRGEKGWSFTKTAKADACKTVPTTTTTPPVTTTKPPVTTTTVPSTTPPAVTTTPPAATTTESVAPTTTPAPVPPAEDDDLADTGASIALPLALGGVLVLGGAGALVAVRRRGAKS